MKHLDDHIISVILAFLTNAAAQFDTEAHVINGEETPRGFDLVITTLGKAIASGLNVGAAGDIVRAHVEAIPGTEQFDPRASSKRIGQVVRVMFYCMYPNDNISEPAYLNMYLNTNWSNQVGFWDISSLNQELGD